MSDEVCCVCKNQTTNEHGFCSAGYLCEDCVRELHTEATHEARKSMQLLSEHLKK